MAGACRGAGWRLQVMAGACTPPQLFLRTASPSAHAPTRHMLRNRLDHLGTHILCDTLVRAGEARAEAEVPLGDAQRIDIWFVPHATRRRASRVLRGILAMLAREPALLELWSGVPNERAFHACLRKRLSWHHALERRDKRRWQMPVLWCISAGRPRSVLDGFGFVPAPEGPSGHYRLPAPRWRVGFVVVSELPRTRETLLLRLLGRRRVRRRAMRELAALPPDAVERRVAQPWLVRLRLELEADPSKLSMKEKEFAMDVHEWYDQWLKERDREAMEKAMEVAMEVAMPKAMEKAIGALAHQFERRLGRALTEAERVKLAKRLGTLGPERVGDVVLDLSPEELAAWLKGRTKGRR